MYNYSMDLVASIIAIASLLVIFILLLFLSIRELNKTNIFHDDSDVELPQIPLNLDKGERGEYIVDMMLKELTDFFGGYVYRELKLEDDYGNWTEIDNVYIGPIGIYLIETKNRCGIIEGDESSRMWTQTNGQYRSDVDNPIFQCQRHEKFFKRVIKNVGAVNTLSIFVSGDISNIKCKNVFNLESAEEFFMKKKRMVSDSKVEYINSQILKFVNNPPFTHQQYASWMRKKKQIDS